MTYEYAGPKPHAVTSTKLISTGVTNSYSYDDNGNMTFDGMRSIAYDYDNKPQSIDINGVTTSFVYDDAGARVRKSSSFGDNIYLGKLYECKEGTCTKYIFE